MEVSQTITRKSASNLALAFILLPKEKRLAMAALYAFCREVDDVADEDKIPVETRRDQLKEWREDIHKACSNQAPKFEVNKELQSVIQQYKLPFSLFDELIKGVEMDLDILRYETWDELDLYCYRVASVVGLLSIEVFGYSNPKCKEYAVLLGKALQLTNILRDVRNDAERGRIYLPQGELRRYCVKPEEVLQGVYSARYYSLAQTSAERAREFYNLARQTLPVEDRYNMATAELMGNVYWKLLQKLQSRRFNVFDFEKTKLSKFQKAALILQTWLRVSTRTLSPQYGAK